MAAFKGTAYMSVSGGRELTARLRELPFKVQKRVTRLACSKVARKMVKLVKASIQEKDAVDSGLMKKSIGFRSWTSKKRAWVVGCTVGPRKGMGTIVTRNKKGKKKALTRKGITKAVAAGSSFSRREYADPAKYAHLPEAGTRERAGGRGRVEGVHFMEHAYKRSAAELTNELREALATGIEREARKLAASRGN